VFSNMIAGMDNATKVGTEMVRAGLGVRLERSSWALDPMSERVEVLMVLKDPMGEDIGVLSTVLIEHMICAPCPWRHISDRMVRDIGEYIREHELPDNVRGEA